MNSNYTTFTSTSGNSLVHFDLPLSEEIEAIRSARETVFSASMSGDYSSNIELQEKWERILLFLGLGRVCPNLETKSNKEVY